MFIKSRSKRLHVFWIYCFGSIFYYAFKKLIHALLKRLENSETG